MISFIVIGRNEGKKLQNCFNSIYNTISFNSIINYEIIYVDSKSIDDSIVVAKKFPEIKIFSVKGECNAAIARNIGAKESTGKILFFIDGDMELNKEFLSFVLDNNYNLKYEFVSGEITDITAGLVHNFRKSDKFLPGGIFLINQYLWMSALGMKTKFTTGEDLDLGLRLNKLGYPMKRKKEVITKHYTIPYLSKDRIWKIAFTKSSYCSRCVLYRNNLFNVQMYKLLWKSDKTFILLLFTIALSFIFLKFSGLFIGIYLFMISIRSFKQKKYISRIELISYFFIYDLMNVILLFSFFPRNKTIDYIKV